MVNWTQAVEQDQANREAATAPSTSSTNWSANANGTRNPQDVSTLVSNPEALQSGYIDQQYVNIPKSNLLQDQTNQAVQAQPQQPQISAQFTGRNVEDQVNRAASNTAQPQPPTGNIPVGVQQNQQVENTTPSVGYAQQWANEASQKADTEIAPQVGQTSMPVGRDQLTAAQRAWIGVFHENDEKIAAFNDTVKKQFPLAQIKPLKYSDGSEELVFKLGPSDSDKWMRVSPTFFEKLNDFAKFVQLPAGAIQGNVSPEQASTAALDVLKDIGDNPVESIAGLAALLTLPITGTGFLATTGAAATIGLIAGGTPEAIAQMKNYAPLDDLKVAKEAAGESLLWALMNTAGYAAGGAYNTVTGRLGIKVPDYMQNIDDAIKKINLTLPEGEKIPLLMPQQMSENMILRRLTAQSAVTSAKINQYIARQNEAVLHYIDNLANPEEYVALRKELKSGIDAYSERLKSVVENPNITYREAADVANKAIQDYAQQGKKTVSDLYTKVRTFAKENGYGEPEYELEGAQKFAADLVEGTRSRGLVVPDELGVPYAPSVRVAPKLPGSIEEGGDSVASVANELLQINPRLTTEMGPITGNEYTPTQQLNDLRQRLYALTLANPFGQRRADEAAAQKLYGLLNDALDKPKLPVSQLGHNGGPFLDEEHPMAWRLTNMLKDASDAACEIFETEENAKLTQMLKQAGADMATTPSSSMKTLLSPSSERMSEHLETLQKIIPAEQFQTIKDAALSHILEKPENITTVLKQWNSANNAKAREILFDPETLTSLKKVGEGFDALASSGVQKAVDDQDMALSLVKQLSENRSTTAQTTLLKITHNSTASKAVRAGLLDNIFDITSQRVGGIDKISSDELMKTINDYSHKGLLRFLRTDDVQNLRNVGDFLSVIQHGEADMGASLHGASEARKVLSPWRLAGLEALVVNRRIGVMMTDPKWQAMIKGDSSSASSLAKAFDLKPIDTKMWGMRAQIALDMAQAKQPAKPVTTESSSNMELNRQRGVQERNRSFGFMGDQR